MKKFSLPVFLILLSVSILSTSAANAENKNRLFFLHHSTGMNMIRQGDVRDVLTDYNITSDSDLVFWDHDYNNFGLKNPAGVSVGYNFNIPGDNTDPDGLHTLWTTQNSARDSILSRFDVIAFKSCYYPTSKISSDAQLEGYKVYYREILDALDQYPAKTFIIMSPPPMNPAASNVGQGDRVRAFANWMGSPDCLEGHTNVRYFNFYDLLANPDDGSSTRNLLREEYQISTTNWHPNELANVTVGPVFINYMASVASESTSPVEEAPMPMKLEQNVPNPFNPSTTIQFSVERDMEVELAIFDVKGRRVRSFPATVLSEGPHSVVWNGKNDQGNQTSSGLYFYRLFTEDGSVTRKMTLTK